MTFGSARSIALATLVIMLGLMAASPARAYDITPDGASLAAMLDAMDVEHHWLARMRVHWETGEPIAPDTQAFAAGHTHCSAFAASAAKRLGVYLLRPPEHRATLLANAQYEWLANEGAAHGWRAVKTSDAAQALADRGVLVVAVYRNHRDDRPGHVAVIRPSEKSSAAIAAEGPDVTQAGGSNYRVTSLARGFAGHPAAWGRSEVRYWSHELDWHALAVEGK